MEQEGAIVTHATAVAQEAEFFNRWASQNATHLERVDPAVIDRYCRSRTIYPKEYCFRILGNFAGKKILDVGCGEGEDAMILAKLGAQVTGLDVSPAAVDLARRRAAVNGVSDRTDFVCAPLNSAKLAKGSFDVIWIDNVLHHVLDDLERTMRHVLEAGRPGALVLCIEPVNLNRTLRRIRFLVPVHTEVTPGERPLEKRDLEALEALIPDLTMRHFRFLARLTRFIIPGFRYERAPVWRRLLCDAIHAFDRVVLSLPVLEDLGGIAILRGSVSRR
jgi:2-polyprenyl-3-methyl-5-hydroxy-6-metoxy-1,4-benzoquinol methylase